MCTDVGLRCKQKIPFLTLPLPAIIKASYASKRLRFVMILAEVNQLYTTSVWEAYPYLRNPLKQTNFVLFISPSHRAAVGKN